MSRSVPLVRLVVLLLAGAALFTACRDEPAPLPEDATEMEDVRPPAGVRKALRAVDYEFQPQTLAVPEGERVTVTFTNEGSEIHTFASEELDFDTGNIEPGETATVFFTGPDEPTQFVCTIHVQSNDMIGQVVPE